MVADAAAKARAYRAHRAAAARAVRFVHVPDGSAPPAEAFAVKRVSFIRHGQGEHNLHDELWKAADKPGNPYGPGPCYSRSCSYHSGRWRRGVGVGCPHRCWLGPVASGPRVAPAVWKATDAPRRRRQTEWPRCRTWWTRPSPRKASSRPAICSRLRRGCRRLPS